MTATGTPWRAGAAWMTADVFVPGGALDKATDDARRMHGARALKLWNDSALRFLDGRPATTALIEQHNRTSFHDYAIWRAACYASVERRLAPTSPAGATPAPTKAPTTAPAADLRTQLGWGRR